MLLLLLLSSCFMSCHAQTNSVGQISQVTTSPTFSSISPSPVGSDELNSLAFLHAQVESTHRLNETSLDVILNTIAVLIHEKLPEIEFELTRKSVTEV
ncbi:unnamed protein product [Knipowitschia caucasica]|uniref:Uncharacterized protein n=1 Tax=Knipowitschia caucasica TaxID=637954 RepID=A0AAV2JQW0_KNICA